MDYNIKTHSHFTIPNAAGDELGYFQTPIRITLVAEGRVYFVADYVVENIPGAKRETPFDAEGGAIFSYPVGDSVRFYCADDLWDMALKLSETTDL